jgi:glycosyltransferase involved in cell wall biosynthesis
MRYGGTPELSIVIPTVDVPMARVRECIDAVRSNTEAEHEIVLVENRSPPQGYTAPVNAGIRAAQGRYVVGASTTRRRRPGCVSRSQRIG